MRLLRRFVMIAVLAAGLAPALVSAQVTDTPIMPLSEVKPGMTGYGLSVFNGEKPERFEFVVRGIVPDFQINDVEVWPWVITVQLSGGPKRADGSALFDKNMIYAGMSGSPMFIDGKLIGGLMSSRDFNSAAQAAITPIELQFGLVALQHAEATRPLTLPLGSYVGACFVFGDSDRCVRSTVTGAYHDHLVTTSHSVGMPYGKLQIPIFEFPVADLAESEAGATKMSGKRGRPIGTAVVHGMFGMVVHEGELPSTVPVKLSIADVFDKPLELNYRMAYHKAGTTYLKAVLNTAVARLPVDPKVAALDITVRIANPAGTVHFRDSANTATESLEQILDYLLDQEKEELRVDGVDVAYVKMPDPDLWSPIAINVEGKKRDGKVTILARRSRDNTVEQMSSPVDTSKLVPYQKMKTQWLDGTSLQSAVLKLIPVRSAFALLEQMQDHDAIYYVALENDESITIDAKAADGVVQRLPKVNILLTQTMGGRRFIAGSESKIKTVASFK